MNLFSPPVTPCLALPPRTDRQPPTPSRVLHPSLGRVEAGLDDDGDDEEEEDHDSDH